MYAIWEKKVNRTSIVPPWDFESIGRYSAAGNQLVDIEYLGSLLYITLSPFLLQLV
jgi:hypothetical protein